MDDLEKILRQLTPRGAPSQLRGQVLDVVAKEVAGVHELRNPSPPTPLPQGERGEVIRWDMRAALAAAGAVLLGLGLNLAVAREETLRLSRLYGPEPVPQRIAEVVETIQSVTDPATARQIEERLLAADRASRPSAEDAMRRYQQVLEKLASAVGGQYEDVQADPQVDGHRGGGGDRPTSYHQCRPALDFRQTA